MWNNKMRTARNEAGITQKELGKRLKVDGSTVGGWERGIRQPKIEMMLKIAIELETKPELIFFR